MDHLWDGFHAVAARGEARWHAFAAELFPVLTKIAAGQPTGRLRAHADTPREIATRVLENLHARDFAAIRKLCATEPPPPLGAWLHVVVRRAAIDYMRASPEYQRATAKRDHRWISLATLSSSIPNNGTDSLVEKREAVLGFLRAAVERARAAWEAHGEDAYGMLALEWDVARIHTRRLCQRGTLYLQVISAVLAGHSYVEIAQALAISRRDVELTVLYIEELLAARKFAR